MAASPPLHYRFGDGDIPENPPPAPPHFRIIEIVAAFLVNIRFDTQACLIIGLRRVRVVEDTDEDEDED